MIYNGVALDGFIGCVDGAGLTWVLRHGQLVIDLDGLPHILHDIVDVQKKYQFALGIAILEELLRRQIDSVSEEVAKDQAHALEELHIRHVLQVLMNVAATSAGCLMDVLAEPIRSPEQKMVHDLERCLRSSFHQSLSVDDSRVLRLFERPPDFEQVVLELPYLMILPRSSYISWLLRSLVSFLTQRQLPYRYLFLLEAYPVPILVCFLLVALKRKAFLHLFRLHNGKWLI